MEILRFKKNVGLEAITEIEKVGRIVNIEVDGDEAILTVLKQEKFSLFNAFAEILKRPKWYEKAGLSEQMASKDKIKFVKEGRMLSEERVRKYLKSNGWKLVNEETWTK